MKPVTKVLLKTAKVLEDFGWCQGDNKLETGECCLDGALRFAVGGDFWSVAKDEFFLYVQCQESLNTLAASGSYVSWNDDACKNEQQAVKFLLLAASISESN